MTLTTLSGTLQYYILRARQLQSAGRYQFYWPLTPEDIRVVKESFPAQDHDRVLLLCAACTKTFLNSGPVPAD